jgi:hypothetical protein
MVERSILRLGLALLTGMSVLGAIAPTVAQGCESTTQQSFGLSPGCVDLRVASAPTATDAAPDFFQAGGHPYEVVSSIRLNAPAEAGSAHSAYWPPEAVRDISMTLPLGLVANSQAVPSCSVGQLVPTSGNPICPPASQVGLVTIYAPGLLPGLTPIELPLFNMVAPAGVLARFGFNSIGGPVLADAQFHPGADGGFAIDLGRLSEALPVNGIMVNLWGVPADPAHTPKRACPGQIPTAGGFPLGDPGPSCAAGVLPRAFLKLPTACAGPQAVSVRTDSWADPGDFQSASTLTHASPGLLGDPTAGGSYPAPYPGLAAEQWGPPEGFSGCAQVPFEPAMRVRPSSQAAGSPTGLDIEVELPQRGLNEPEAIAEADLEEAVTTLPAGLSLNPSVANGLTSCSAAQVDLGSNDPAACPDSSKFGTVEMTTPLLAAPLSGSIYDAQRQPDQPSTGLPAYVVIDSGGVSIKLRTEVEIDRGSGRMTARFGEGPQIPIGRLRLHFFGGERALFVNPSSCGRYAAEGSFTPWSGTGAVRATDAFEITSGPRGGPCPSGPADRPFSPGFRAGVTSPLAGAASSLTVKLTREDGEQEPSSLEMSLPAGLTAALGDVASCPDADITGLGGRSGSAELGAPSCPLASRVGGASAAIGAGTEPFYLKTGSIYLAGPYEGAGFSLLVVLPAVAGPIDLNTLVVRLPLKMDPGDGHLTIASALPTVQNGVHLNLRQMTLNVDRPGFISNPTSCRLASIDGRIIGDGGATASVSSPFQMLDCASLPFKPGLRMKVLGGLPATRHTAHPALRTVLKARPGEANLRRASILFADSEQLDPAHIRGICKGPEFAAGKCPKGSVYGHAKLFSPLLGTPLEGPVYLRASSHKLPDLVAALSGKFDLDLGARIGFAEGRLSIELGSLPDLPLSRLILTTWGGRRGLFVNNRSLCAAPSFSTATLTAQSGRLAKRRPRLDVPCGAAG